MDAAGLAGASRATDLVALDLDTPALVVDIDTVVGNLEEMSAVAMAAGVDLMPHAKTHRIAELGLLQIEHGAKGLCVAKLGEAEYFADAGVERLMVAYPVVGRTKARRALALHRRATIAFGADSVRGIHDLAECFGQAGEVATVMIAVDTGLGREGLSAEGAADLADVIAATPGVTLGGIYTHEGTTYEATSRADLAERARRAAEFMVATAEGIRSRGHVVAVVSLGASASARLVAGVPGVTEIRPGIYAFNDVGQVALENTTVDGCAIRVLTTVVSSSAPGRALIDAGTKALGGDLVPASGLRDRYPGYGLVVNGQGWIVERLSEEHGWLRWHGEGAPPVLPVGTRLAIIPNHACMAFAMLRRAVIVQSGAEIARWDAAGPGTSV